MCIGMSWPARAFEVTIPKGAIWKESYGTILTDAAIVVRELDPTVLLGPQGQQVAALIERNRRLSTDESQAIGAARTAARTAAWDVAWDAAWTAAALVVRDLITTGHYDILTRPWRATIGPIHPDDPDWKDEGR
jgi:hypothetical protein